MSTNLTKPLRLRNDGGAQLQLERSTALTSLETTSGGGFSLSTAGTLALAATGANVITLATNGVTRVHVSSAGDVGIGVTSPVSGLHYRGVSEKNFTIDRDGEASFVGFGLNGIDFRARFDSTNYGTGARILPEAAAAWTASSHPTNLRFFLTPSGSTTAIERMRITAAGDVGIGTTSPGARLEAHASNPSRGIIADLRNTALSGQTGAQLQFTQLGIGNWAVGLVPSADAFAIYSGRSVGADGAERMRITAAGDVQLPSGSPGIKFGTRNANLADYEEGTWTYAFSFAGGGSATPQLATGQYVKIGNVVTAWCFVQTSAISSPSGNLTITGLPFTSTSIGCVSFGLVSRWATNFSATLTGETIGADILIYKNDSTVNAAENIQGSDFASGSGQNRMRITVTYPTV